MKKENEKSYSVTITCSVEVTSIIANIYDLQSNSDVFFADLKLEITNIDVANIIVPTNRQTNTREELLVTHTATISFKEKRENDIVQLTKKIKNVFGNNCSVDIIAKDSL